jgi:hypothetical protein
MPKPNEGKYAPCECKPNQKYKDKLTEKTLTKKPVEMKPKKKLNPANVFVMKNPPKKPKKKAKKKRKRPTTI